MQVNFALLQAGTAGTLMMKSKNRTIASSALKDLFQLNGACAHYVMVSKFQWKPFWLATQRDPQNDWTVTQNRVNYNVFAQAPLLCLVVTV